MLGDFMFKDNKKYKKEYDILVNDFDRIITDIKISK